MKLMLYHALSIEITCLFGNSEEDREYIPGIKFFTTDKGRVSLIIRKSTTSLELIKMREQIITINLL